MGFKIYSIDAALTRSIEYLPASALVPVSGMAMKLDGGLLKAVSASDKPDYICLREQEKALEAGDVLPVIRVGADIIFETETEANMSEVKIGTKVTVNPDDMTVTATEGGSAEIVGMEATNYGTYIVRVRFN